MIKRTNNDFNNFVILKEISGGLFAVNTYIPSIAGHLMLQSSKTFTDFDRASSYFDSMVGDDA